MGKEVNGEEKSCFGSWGKASGNVRDAQPWVAQRLQMLSAFIVRARDFQLQLFQKDLDFLAQRGVPISMMWCAVGTWGLRPGASEIGSSDGTCVGGNLLAAATSWSSGMDHGIAGDECPAQGPPLANEPCAHAPDMQAGATFGHHMIEDSFSEEFLYYAPQASAAFGLHLIEDTFSEEFLYYAPQQQLLSSAPGLDLGAGPCGTSTCAAENPVCDNQEINKTRERAKSLRGLARTDCECQEINKTRERAKSLSGLTSVSCDGECELDCSKKRLYGRVLKVLWGLCTTKTRERAKIETEAGLLAPATCARGRPGSSEPPGSSSSQCCCHGLGSLADGDGGGQFYIAQGKDDGAAVGAIRVLSFWQEEVCSDGLMHNCVCGLRHNLRVHLFLRGWVVTCKCKGSWDASEVIASACASTLMTQVCLDGVFSEATSAQDQDSAAASRSCLPEGCSGPTGLRFGGGNPFEGMMASITEQLMPMITALIQKAVQEAIANAMGGAPATPPRVVLQEPDLERGPKRHKPDPTRKNHDSSRHPTSREPGEGKASGGRGGQPVAAKGSAKGAAKGSAEVSPPKSGSKGKGQGDRPPRDAEGWTKVQRAPPQGPFQLRSQDWSAQLLSQDGIAKALDDLKPGSALEAVILVEPSALPRIRSREVWVIFCVSDDSREYPEEIFSVTSGAVVDLRAGGDDASQCSGTVWTGSARSNRSKASRTSSVKAGTVWTAVKTSSKKAVSQSRRDASVPSSQRDDCIAGHRSGPSCLKRARGAAVTVWSRAVSSDASVHSQMPALLEWDDDDAPRPERLHHANRALPQSALVMARRNRGRAFPDGVAKCRLCPFRRKCADPVKAYAAYQRHFLDSHPGEKLGLAPACKASCVRNLADGEEAHWRCKRCQAAISTADAARFGKDSLWRFRREHKTKAHPRVSWAVWNKEAKSHSATKWASKISVTRNNAQKAKLLPVLRELEAQDFDAFGWPRQAGKDTNTVDKYPLRICPAWVCRKCRAPCPSAEIARKHRSVKGQCPSRTAKARAWIRLRSLAANKKLHDAAPASVRKEQGELAFAAAEKALRAPMLSV
ncbi:unnamed protein product [Symbiodinium sp. CCMP2592]|nr:unnamed protein product [Symbiodinium sp. CCMP2592]